MKLLTDWPTLTRWACATHPDLHGGWSHPKRVPESCPNRRANGSYCGEPVRIERRAKR